MRRPLRDLHPDGEPFQIDIEERNQARDCGCSLLPVPNRIVKLASEILCAAAEPRDGRGRRAVCARAHIRQSPH